MRLVGNQRGGALIVVMMVGMVISIGMMGFLTSSVLVEQRAVDGALAQTRAYWAEMGHMNYALSRISYSKLCNGCGGGNNKDIDLAPVLQAYLNELANYKTWTYPDASASYSITVTETAAVDEDSTRQTYSGWLKMTSSYSASSVVNGLNSHLPLLELRLCVGRPAATGPAAKCGNVNVNNGGNTTAYYSISRLTNLPG